MGKIEPQPIGRDQRSVLFHMWSQQIAQRGMHQMSGGMIPRGILPGLPVDGQMHPLAFTNRAGTDDSLMDDQRGHRPRGLTNLDTAFGPDQEPLVPGLPSALRIEGRDVQNHFDFIPFDELLSQPVSLEQGLHHAVGFKLLVSDEFRVTQPRRQFGDRRPGRFRLEAPRFPGTIALLFDGSFEAGFITRILCSRQASVIRSSGNP